MVRIEAASLSSGRVRRYSLAGETNHGPLKTFYPELARTRCLFRGSLILGFLLACEDCGGEGYTAAGTRFCQNYEVKHSCISRLQLQPKPAPRSRYQQLGQPCDWFDNDDDLTPAEAHLASLYNTSRFRSQKGNLGLIPPAEGEFMEMNATTVSTICCNRCANLCTTSLYSLSKLLLSKSSFIFSYKVY